MGQLALRLSGMYTTAQQEQNLHSLCDNIDTLVGDGQVKLAWAAINKLSGRKSRSNGIVTAEDNIHRLKLWNAHFRSLLISPEASPVRSNLLEPSQGL
jgi:hypothetical protein